MRSQYGEAGASRRRAPRGDADGGGPSTGPRRHVAAAGLALAAALTACGGHSGDHRQASGRHTTARATSQPAAPPDKGPLCVGTAPADGLHVLRGGAYPLPGGSGVRYTVARADGTTRTATLTEGLTPDAGGAAHTVRPGQTLTVRGHAYAVDQICAYRVVLEPRGAADRAAAAARPASLKAGADPADQRRLCFSTDPAVRAANAAALPPAGAPLRILTSGPTRLATGISIAAYDVDPSTGTARFGAVCSDGGTPESMYEDVRAGDTVEVAGALFTVAPLTTDVITLTRKGS